MSQQPCVSANSLAMDPEACTSRQPLLGDVEEATAPPAEVSGRWRTLLSGRLGSSGHNAMCSYGALCIGADRVACHRRSPPSPPLTARGPAARPARLLFTGPLLDNLRGVLAYLPSRSPCTLLHYAHAFYILCLPTRTLLLPLPASLLPQPLPSPLAPSPFARCPDQEAEADACDVARLLSEQQANVLRYLQTLGVAKEGEFEEQVGVDGWAGCAARARPPLCAPISLPISPSLTPCNPPLAG